MLRSDLLLRIRTSSEEVYDWCYRQEHDAAVATEEHTQMEEEGGGEAFPGFW